MSALDFVLILLIGLTAGTVGGMLGVGGSIVIIPALTEAMGPNQHLYQSAAMIVNFFVVVPAVLRHRRARAIDAGIVLRLMPIAVVSVVAGVALSELSVFRGANEPYLRGLFGLFLMAVAVYELVRMSKKDNQALLPNGQSGSRAEGHASESRGSQYSTPGGSSAVSPSWPRIAAVAIPTGLIAGLLGVGGGLLAVPLQRRILGIDIRCAIANSATVIIATSFLGAGVKNYAFASHDGSFTRPLLLAAALIPTAMLGSMQGSRLTHRLPISTVRFAFLLLLLVAAWRQGSPAILSLL